MRCGRTLIVEDDPDNQRALARLLKIVGEEVATAASVAEARERLAWMPTCVLLDLQLEDGSGVEILREIRGSNLPMRVALITGSVELSPLANDKDLKPDAVFLKPFEPAALIRWVTDCEPEAVHPAPRS